MTLAIRSKANVTDRGEVEVVSSNCDRGRRPCMKLERARTEGGKKVKAASSNIEMEYSPCNVVRDSKNEQVLL